MRESTNNKKFRRHVDKSNSKRLSYFIILSFQGLALKEIDYFNLGLSFKLLYFIDRDLNSEQANLGLGTKSRMVAIEPTKTTT